MYYDGTKLLSLRDINGNKPELFLCTSNRSAGKTTFFTRLAFNRFFKRKEKTIFLYRFSYELAGCADKIFKEVSALFFPEYTLISKPCGRGLYHELYIGKKTDAENWKTSFKHCGYAVSLNSADALKKLSHLFSDTKLMIFDEFQSETGHYCQNEIERFISLHTSIARGNGSQVKYLPVIMISNPVTILNPYFITLGISSRLDNKTKYLRGDGYVLEQSFNVSASDAQKKSAFNRAFSGNKYIAYAAESVYLNDKRSFIDKPSGRSFYIATIRYNGVDYGIREYTDKGIVYCDDHPDLSFKYRITTTLDDHTPNYLLAKRNDVVLSTIKFFFEKGLCRFKNMECKAAVLSCVGIS